MSGNMKEKIQKIQKEVGKLKKDTPGYNYKYFDINQLLEKLRPLLEENKLVVTQPIENGEVVTRIQDIETDDQITSSIKLPENVKPQDLGSAITYYRRYSLVSLLALEAEDDDGKQAQESSTGVSQEVLDRFLKAYKEKETITPDMQEYYEKFSPAQMREVKKITKEIRAKRDKENNTGK